MNRTAAIFTLSRLLHLPGDAEGVGKMVAASPGLTRVHWDECRRIAPLLPPPSQGYPQGSMALYRGQTIDFILARTRSDTASGLTFVEYTLLTAEVMRQIAGRTRLLSGFVPVEKQKEEEKGLQPVRLVVPPPPTEDQLVDDLSRFLLALDDDFAIAEGLLAALVQGMPVSIIRAPGDLDTQLNFLQGLLALLPLPARFSVSFSTFVRRFAATPVQVAFMANDVPPAETLCYDWHARQLIGKPPADPYSRFIVRQVRLDPASAIEQMVSLTRTAAWRLTRGEPLATALGWASRRVALDAAVLDGQPADADQIATVLREDPTLTPNLRVRYVRHLLAFILALEEPGESGIIARLARAHLDVDTAVQEMLNDAVGEGKAPLVFQLVVNWLALPNGPEGSGWQHCGHKAAAAYLRDLVADGDIAGVSALLNALHEAPDKLGLGEAVPQIVEIALPLASRSSELARLLFLLGADYLPAAAFQDLVQTKDLTPRMPEPFRAGLIHFQAVSPEATPKGLLARMAASFGDAWEQIVLVRLVEWVIVLGRVDLIDVPTLGRLVSLARSAYGERFRPVLLRVVEALSEPAVLKALEAPGPRLLVEILLQLDDFQSAVTLIERAYDHVFAGEQRRYFTPWVSEIFQYTTLESEALIKALEALVRIGLSHTPTAMAYRGALLNKGFDPALGQVIDRLAEAVVEDGRLVRLIGYNDALRLLQYYARQKQAEQSVGLARVITKSVGGAEDGLDVVLRIWTMLNWNKEVRHTSLDLLRQYVRRVPPELAYYIPVRVRRKLGNKVGEMLQATVTLNVMVGGKPFVEFVEEVRVANAFLSDVAAAYANDPPPMTTLRSALDTLSGGLSEPERQQLSENLLTIAQRVYALGEARGSSGRRRANIEQKMIETRDVPKCGVDALLWIGGHFAKGHHIPPQLERASMQNVTGSRTVTRLLQETTLICDLLARLADAFPADKPPSLTLEAMKAEVESLWQTLEPPQQKEHYDNFSINIQGVGGLIGLMYEQGDQRAINDSGYGRGLETARREPKNALEVLRLFSGYFGRKFRL